MVASGAGLNVPGKDLVKREDVTLGKGIHFPELAFPNLGE